MDPVILFVTAESRGGDAVIAHADVTSPGRPAWAAGGCAGQLGQRVPAAAGAEIGGTWRRRSPGRQSASRSPSHRIPSSRRGRGRHGGAGPDADCGRWAASELFSSAVAPVRARRRDDCQRRVSRAARYARVGALLRVAASRGGPADVGGRARMGRGQDEGHARGAGWHAGRGEVVNPSESDALLGPPRPRLLATTARIQTVLLESGLLTQSIPLAADLQMAGRRRSGAPAGADRHGAVQTEPRPQLPSLQAPAVPDAVPARRSRSCSTSSPTACRKRDSSRPSRATQLLRATEIQSRTERAAERNELETGQREFGELAVFEELRAAVFVSPENLVVLSSRRDWSGRPLDLAALGLAPRRAERGSRRRWSRRAGPDVSSRSSRPIATTWRSSCPRRSRSVRATSASIAGR